MNRYFLLHRVMGPAILLLLGVVALLSQAHVVRFSIFVPLLLILIGVIKLAQRAILTQQPLPPNPYPGAGYYPQGMVPTGQNPGAPYQGSYQGSYQAPYQAPYQGTGNPGVIPPPAAAPTQDFGNDPEGGK
jgi:hypothetical protein